MTHPLDFLADDPAVLDVIGSRSPVLQGEPGARGLYDGRPVLNFGSDNYLGFAANPKLRHAAIAAIEKTGIGAGSPRGRGGTMAIHADLERRLADFTQTEAAAVFPSGDTANAATISVIAGREDLILYDAGCDSAIQTGIRLSGANGKAYPHLDLDLLRTLLKGTRGTYRRTFIVSDGVFAMTGEVAPLPDLVDLADRMEAIVMVNDAHGIGLHGPQGRGTIAYYDLQGQIPVHTGSLAKAIGGMGGFAAGPKVLIEALYRKARPLLHSTGLPPAVAAAAIAALDLLERSPELLEQLWINAKQLQVGLQALGFQTVDESPIQAVPMPDVWRARRFSDRLLEEGLYAPAMGFPYLPVGQARLRLVVTAAHSPFDIEEGLDILGTIGRELGLVP